MIIPTPANHLLKIIYRWRGRGRKWIFCFLQSLLTCILVVLHSARCSITKNSQHFFNQIQAGTLNHVQNTILSVYNTCFLNAGHERCKLWYAIISDIQRLAAEVVLYLLPPGYVNFEINDNRCDNNSKFILEVRADAKAEVED